MALGVPSSGALNFSFVGGFLAIFLACLAFR